MTNLRKVLYRTHELAAERENISRQVLIQSYRSNGRNVIASITCAMNTMGGLHAPIKQTYSWIKQLRDGEIDADEIARCRKEIFTSTNGRVPGFGSSFTDYIDHLLEDINAKLIDLNPDYISAMVSVRDALFDYGDDLYPNIAFYTAAVALIEGVSEEMSISLAIEPRIPVWIKILNEL